MIIEIFLVSFIVGVVTTLPVGPAGISIVNSFINRGTGEAVRSFGGLFLAEVVYLTLSFSLYRSMNISAIFDKKILFVGIFSFVLFVIGMSFLRSKDKKEINLPSGFKGVFLLAIFNPSLVLTYLTFIGFYERIFGLKLNLISFLYASSSMVIGVGATLCALSLLALAKRDVLFTNMVLVKRGFGLFFITSALCSLGGAL
ncbi:putative membrane protein [Halobacteriovorax marinus SJ]|uniref:Membrane protein n=1 Tax=Halobacteriovorax marinus (strain ATCC BAA-682 / DSM 15412 / SJ) TaxID=862908 RepID=E1WXR8_HALMS|nr:hypothetical protein [Halobacteriovorax marinus]CBW25875.1 putative membrane protein [Halobacteriovorax marinus SJ]